MQHLTVCGDWQQQFVSCSLLDWPSGWSLHSNNTVNIHYITKWYYMYWHNLYIYMYILMKIVLYTF